VKILLVVSSLGGGGTERAAADLSTFLAERHQVAVLPFHDRASYRHGGRLLPSPMTYTPPSGLLSRIARLVKKYRALKEAVELGRPDVMMSLGDGANLVALLCKFTGAAPVPVVVNAQVAPLRNYRGIERLLYLGLMKVLYPRADAIVAISSGIGSELSERFRVPAGRVRVIPNPIDLDEILRKSRDTADLESPGSPMVLTVGRLASQKNHELLLRAFREVRRELGANLVILGEGPLRPRLEELARRLEVHDSVSLLGWRDNPFSFMRSAEVMVLPSEYEGFGNVLVEAMACGCPVVATDCPYGPSEILGGGRYGVLVERGNERALALAIRSLLTDRERAAALGRAGLERARDFALERIGARYESVLEACVASRGGLPARAEAQA
jgi:glycosyltransferase involved in cell wall biosynthesis